MVRVVTPSSLPLDLLAKKRVHEEIDGEPGEGSPAPLRRRTRSSIGTGLNVGLPTPPLSATEASTSNSPPALSTRREKSPRRDSGVLAVALPKSLRSTAKVRGRTLRTVAKEVVYNENEAQRRQEAVARRTSLLSVVTAEKKSVYAESSSEEDEEDSDESGSDSDDENESGSEDEQAGVNTKYRKEYRTEGLYVGLPTPSSSIPPPPPTRRASTRTRTPTSKSKSFAKPKAREPFWPLPMLAGAHLVDPNTFRPFQLPHNLHAPSRQRAPKNYRKILKNIYVDIPRSALLVPPSDRPSCSCEPGSGCGDNCWNRALFWECDDTTCGSGPGCGNRAFQEMDQREKEKKRNRNVEVVKTKDRGCGIRALRDFEPGRFVVEYRGEVISSEECQRRTMERMQATKAKAKEAVKSNNNNTNNKGKGKPVGGGEDHYFLALHKSTMIDAHTRANEGRFANHSCSPNAKVEKWYVKGEPRVGIFACEKGVGVGEEVTYDYCFEWFEGAVEQECRCGAVGCRGFIGKKGRVEDSDSDSQSESESESEEEAEVITKGKAKRKSIGSAVPSAGPVTKKLKINAKGLLGKAMSKVVHAAKRVFSPAVAPKSASEAKRRPYRGDRRLRRR
ncbi:hypothetical protein YB2330_005829 [Saitoella coloradoensis]